MFGLKLKSCGLTNLVGIIVFGKLSAINGFVDSLPVAVCSRIANSFMPFRHGELITIFGAAVKPSLNELSALWLSCSRICDALAVRRLLVSSVALMRLNGLGSAYGVQLVLSLKSDLVQGMYDFNDEATVRDPQEFPSDNEQMQTYKSAIRLPKLMDNVS
ncbi:hypothetical protein Tco_0654121 [Tanacetum coccineum]|uniref:Uncharacterized protein n=1 Tax=Tanacetum coccineum TaxID=301880 RepID=A0ABQ4X2I0_9ASTR